MGFDTHMILETVPVLPSTRQNAHQAINPTSRHYAEALPLSQPTPKAEPNQTVTAPPNQRQPRRPNRPAETASTTTHDGIIPNFQH